MARARAVGLCAMSRGSALPTQTAPALACEARRSTRLGGRASDDTSRTARGSGGTAGGCRRRSDRHWRRAGYGTGRRESDGLERGELVERMINQAGLAVSDRAVVDRRAGQGHHSMPAAVDELEVRLVLVEPRRLQRQEGNVGRL